MTLLLNESFSHYNDTFNDTFYEMNARGFASASHSTVTTRYGYEIVGEGSLSFSHSQTQENLYTYWAAARGYGSMAETDFNCDDSKICEVDCRGDNSCFNATITTDDCGGYKVCNGATSCAHSTHLMGSRCFADICSDGMMANYKSDLITDGDYAEYYFEMGGFLAGYGYDIYCNETDYCNIECTTPMACLNTTVHCFNDSKCSIVNECDNSQGIWCPTVIRYNETDEDRIRMYCISLAC